MATVQSPSANPPFALPRSGAPSTRKASLLGPVAMALVLHALLLAAYLAAFRGNLSALVCADRAAIGRYPFEAVNVGFGAGGFDGQFYYTLARNPWAPQAAFLDLPAYRHGRILLPALAWLATAGERAACSGRYPSLTCWP